jgi:hypothetical protein
MNYVGVEDLLWELVGKFRNLDLNFRDFREADFGGIDEIRAFLYACGAALELTDAVPEADCPDEYFVIKDMCRHRAGPNFVSLVDTVIMLQRQGVLFSRRHLTDVNDRVDQHFYDRGGNLKFPVPGLPLMRGVYQKACDVHCIYEALEGGADVGVDVIRVLSLSRLFRKCLQDRGNSSKRMVSFGVMLNNTYEKFYYEGVGRVVHAGSGPIGRLSQFCYPKAESVIFIDPVINMTIQDFLKNNSGFDVLVSDAAVYTAGLGLHCDTNLIVEDIWAVVSSYAVLPHLILKISVETVPNIGGLWGVKHWGRPHNLEVIIESGGSLTVEEIVRRKRNCLYYANWVRNHSDYYRMHVDMKYVPGRYAFGNYFDVVKPELCGGRYVLCDLGPKLPGGRVRGYMTDDNILGDIDGRYVCDVYRYLISNGYAPGRALGAIASEADRRGLLEDDTTFYHLMKF